MFGNTIFFISASFGFLCTALIFKKIKNQEHSLVNKYLIIITTINALRFLFHGISKAYPEIDISKFVTFLDTSMIMMIPCFYLYFENIIYENKFKVGNLLHFIVPILLGSIYISSIFVSLDNEELVRKLFFFFGILFCLTYAYLGFVMLYHNVWNRKSEIKIIQKQNNLIKKWTIFLYVCIVLMLLIRVITSFISDNPGRFNNNYLWISALLWLVFFGKIILTPEILYGFNLINKTIDEATEMFVLNSIWLIEGTVIPINIEREKKIDEKMKPLLMGYLHQIEDLSFHTHAFRNPNLSLDDIALALNIPSSHINFIFKYHCKESFTDYKKIVRIHDATKLLEGGYLKENKVETLSAEVGFASYNTFNIAFKSITGVTTHEYGKRY